MGLDKLANTFTKILTEPQREVKPYDTEATVTRVDDDGRTAWVHIPGGVDETPVEMTIKAKPGDRIKMRVSGRRAWITGNGDAPPTDDTLAAHAYSRANTASAGAAKAKVVADEAKDSANVANEAAKDANASASDASASAGATQYNLDEVKKLVDFENWINQHCTCILTTDTEVVGGKFYFTLEGGEYVSVTPDEDANPSSLGLYELSDIDASITGFVDTHLVIEDNGDLTVQTDGIKTKLKLSGSGLQLINEYGNIVSTFSDTITLGDTDGMHLTLSPGDDINPPELGFWQGATEVAYINANTLYIKQARIEETLRIGQFTWKVQSANRISLVYTSE